MFSSVEGQAATSQVYGTASGSRLTVEGISQKIKDYDVVVFGEYHDNPVLHRLEKELLTAVYEQYPNVAVSLEMFERDNQQILNAYLAGRVSEEAFLEQSRPWPNYRSDYRPLVEFAKTEELPVLAANIPRAIAAQYARSGMLAAVEETLRQYLPRIHSTPDGEYRQRFFGQMQAMSDKHSAMPVTEKQMEAFYRAQCLKDDTMAESILDYHRRYPDRKIIHYQGDFHSRYRLGVVEKLQALAPELKILVITPVYVDDFQRLSEKARSLQADGDIVVFVHQKELSR
ncbi:ChaN family lipoprotein [Anaerospora hongkongensis]|uniref:ChaN family lipoprotein n=1 Tax=Anaerospora hongkongensis TaxID=244830 RepID=UPI0028A0196F|nr:ChaN family lipoprotein [Anaerospora hongkongensis]